MEPEPTEHTKSKAGRKLSGTEPLTRRAQLNRENQRKFRQRKEQYVANLERQNAEFNEIVAAKNTEAAVLQASVSSLQDEIVSLKRLVSQLEVANRVMMNQPTPPISNDRNSCRMCSLERANAVFSDGQVKVLSLKLAAAEAEIQNLKEIGNSMRNQPYSLPSGFDFLFASSSTNMVALEKSDFAELVPHTNPIRTNDSQQALLSNSTSSSGSMHTSIPFSNHGFLAATGTGTGLKNSNSESIILTTSPNESSGDDWMDEFMMANDALPPPVAFVKQRVASAESLYGPMRVEFARYSMKCIPALKNSPLVDEWVEASISMTRATTRLKMKKGSIRAVGAWLKVLRECAVRRNDFKFATEIYFKCLDLNRCQMVKFPSFACTLLDYVFQTMSEGDPPREVNTQRAPLPSKGMSLRNGLLKIPSLSTCVQEIEELCFTFLTVPFTASDFAYAGRLIRAMQARCINYAEKTELQSQLFQFDVKVQDLSEKKFEDALTDLDKIESQ
ncbi:hypothetical protein HDU81_009825 [Chytriomyces hyalinus]|nr:hypothetical protein HDU81_009825 [Chytriomyces hyalinus]